MLSGFYILPFYPGTMLSLSPQFRTGLPPQINLHSQILQFFLLNRSTNQSTSLHPVPAPAPVAAAVPILLSGLIRPCPLAPFDRLPKAARVYCRLVVPTHLSAASICLPAPSRTSKFQAEQDKQKQRETSGQAISKGC